MYYKVGLFLRGTKTEIIIEAENKVDALEKVKVKHGSMAKVFMIQESDPPLEEKIKKLKESIFLTKHKKIKIKDLLVVIRQLAVMTNAGISLNEALKEIARNTPNKKLSEMAFSISKDIDSGVSLSQSVEKFKNQLGHLTVTMIKLGEQTGNIANNLFKLADILEELQGNIAKFKKAIRYPIITIVAMIVAFTILIVYVVPKFESVFRQYNAPLPLPTKILLGLEHAFLNYGPYILAGLIALIVYVVYMYKTHESFKYKIDYLMLKTYLIKDIVYYNTMAQFTNVFTELLSAGLPLINAIEQSTNMITNKYMQSKMKTIKTNVEKGSSLTDAFKNTEMFEPMTIQMIKSGESSGQLENMMVKITEYYKMKFNYILDNLSSYIEPILMFFIAGAILLLALGIFLPMWDMSKVVKGVH